MVPLAIVALLAVLMILERTVFLSRVDLNADRLLAAIVPLVRDGEFDRAVTVTTERKGPIQRVLRAGIIHGRKTVEGLEEVLQEAILAELPVLERFLTSLGVFAAIAPLLGLLGTVSGMIGTFQVITVYGTGNPRLLSGGISEALITTEVGLAMAVPILLAHALLSRRVRTIVSHMDRSAMSLANVIRQGTDAWKAGEPSAGEPRTGERNPEERKAGEPKSEE